LSSTIAHSAYGITTTHLLTGTGAELLQVRIQRHDLIAMVDDQ